MALSHRSNDSAAPDFVTIVPEERTAAGLARIFAVTAGLFVIWGLALWLYNALFFKFSHFFALGPVQIAWTSATFHLAYVLLALPAVLFHRRFGFKLGLLAGLSVFGIGAFLLYLAIAQHATGYFLCAVMVIGSCGAWLDTALNPLAAIAGAPQTLLRRMNVVHAFNGVGLLAAYVTALTLLGRDYVLSSGTSAQTSAGPYVLVGLGAILLAFLVEQVQLPAFVSKGVSKAPSLAIDLSALRGDKEFMRAALALGAYCAVLTVLWTAAYKYQHSELPGRVVVVLERGWFWFLAGRLAGLALMRWIAPLQLLLASAGLCLVMIAMVSLFGGHTGWMCLLVASFCLSISYPTIFGTALQQHGTRLAVAAGVMVIAAGIGNALSSLGTSLALDAFQINPRLVIAMALPFEAVVLYFAWRAHSPGRS